VSALLKGNYMFILFLKTKKETRMLENFIILKSEHVKFPDDIYITLKCDRTTDYIKNFPITGRIIDDDDPELKIECVIDLGLIKVLSKETNRTLFTVKIIDLFTHDFKDLSLKKLNNYSLISDIKHIFIFVYRPIFTERYMIAKLSNPFICADYEKIYINTL
jgi:hypothetical protein